MILSEPQLTPFEQAVCAWILALPGAWTKIPAASLTATQEKALKRLVIGGFVEARLANWQAVTELSIGPSGTTVTAGLKEKVNGKPWQGPRNIRNLRWEGGKYSRQTSTDASVSPQEVQRNFDDAIKKSPAQEKLDGK